MTTGRRRRRRSGSPAPYALYAPYAQPQLSQRAAVRAVAAPPIGGSGSSGQVPATGRARRSPCPADPGWVSIDRSRRSWCRVGGGRGVEVDLEPVEARLDLGEAAAEVDRDRDPPAPALGDVGGRQAQPRIGDVIEQREDFGRGRRRSRGVYFAVKRGSKRRPDSSRARRPRAARRAGSTAPCVRSRATSCAPGPSTRPGAGHAWPRRRRAR